MKFLFTCAFLLALNFAEGQSNQANLTSEMRWRCIGPFRGGRTVGATGVPSQPNVFYIGLNNGGVWRSNDYGRTWKPIFDDQPTGSVGDLVVSPSDPNVIYVGCGEGIQRPDLSIGNGVYKSTDSGKTWVNTGLKDGQQIGGLAIDPKDPNRVFAAVLGHPYGPNSERGVYRTLDGGKNWDRVLYKDENTGAVQVTLDPKNSNIVYADMWAQRLGPWENGVWSGPESGLFKSTDGGTTWTKLTNGLPTFEEGLGRIGFCIAPSDPNRLYATVDAKDKGGIYRSDDAGQSWRRTNSDNRVWGRASDFAELKVDPKNPDVVYSANVAFWKSTDGGTNWTSVRGAPGGDDYHRIWINPDDPKIMLVAADQGVIITVNGGETYSSWYNQPTAQIYHIVTDNALPYNVYGSQQESGSFCITSRGRNGQITFRDWFPVGAEEWGYLAPDPLDPNIVYGGKLSKHDKRTGQTQSVEPYPTGHYGTNRSSWRFLRTAPVIFSQADKRTLYYAGNVLFRSRDGAHSWTIISPDLSRETWDVPKNVGVYDKGQLKTMPRRGVIYTVAPSPIDTNIIWAGTDDGLIHITRDGGASWSNVTPSGVGSWGKISLIDADYRDANIAYAAVNNFRLDDLRPAIYKTRDGGKSWKKIVNGLPDEPINVVRVDPLKAGLLFAGSENAVYASLDDGENWFSLRNNMPATSIRDLVVKDNDIVAGTHGRSAWILDDISRLRQWSGGAGPGVYTADLVYRYRWNLNTDTPLPPEEPGGENPPDGVVIDYFIKSKPKGVVSLEILDNDKVIRRYTSADKPRANAPLNFPDFWLRSETSISTEPGFHRFVWDMHHEPLDEPMSYNMSAIYKNSPPVPNSPLARPGVYTIRLTVDGKSFTDAVTIAKDPRILVSDDEVRRSFDLSMVCYEGRKQTMPAINEIASVRTQVAMLIAKVKDPLAANLKEFDGRLAELESKPEMNFKLADERFKILMNMLTETDMPATKAIGESVTTAKKWLEALSPVWNKIKSEEIVALNKQIKKAGLTEIKFP